jgi:glycosyltransferase involved in cell wall biosynthesis
MATVHLVLPDSVDDPQRPSGGNVYDRRIRAGLRERGHDVGVHLVGEPTELKVVLADLDEGATVLVDGLLASAAPAVADAATERLRLFVLVHLPFGTPGEDELFRAAAGVVTTSHWTRDRLLRTSGVDPDRVHAAPPGADRAPLATGSPDGRRLLCVAPLTTAKGYDDLLAALAAVADLSWTCHCVGSVDKEPACAARVRDAIDAQRLDDRVHLTGPLAGPALEAAYADADLLVLPSHGETFGLVVTEALAHGLPVLATDAGGVPEALGTTRQGDPGMLVRPERPDLLADALRSWLTDVPLRDSLRSRATERRTTLAPWSDTVALVEEVLLR